MRRTWKLKIRDRLTQCKPSGQFYIDVARLPGDEVRLDGGGKAEGEETQAEAARPRVVEHVVDGNPLREHQPAPVEEEALNRQLIGPGQRDRGDCQGQQRDRHHAREEMARRKEQQQAADDTAALGVDLSGLHRIVADQKSAGRVSGPDLVAQGDPVKFELKKSFVVDAAAYDVTASDAGIAFISGGTGDWTDVTAVDVHKGAVAARWGGVWARSFVQLDRDQRGFLRNDALRVWEIVDNTARLCVMNLFLHGIGSDEEGREPVHVKDSLLGHPGEYFDMALTNPPFGRKSSLSVVNEKGRSERETSTIVRDDFWASTSNKQLNFVQHIKSLLKIHGRAAVVVPDNVLFEGGAGETIRRKLLQECDVHTLLRLPTGIFYAQGVKANVLFFDKKPASATHRTERLWVYDLRTNQNFTLRTNPLTRTHLDDFVACYHPENRHQRHESERFHVFSYDDILKRAKVSHDLFWLRDESLEGADALPSPDVLAASIVEDLQAALEQFTAIADDLGNGTVGGGK